MGPNLPHQCLKRQSVCFRHVKIRCLTEEPAKRRSLTASLGFSIRWRAMQHGSYVPMRLSPFLSIQEVFLPEKALIPVVKQN